MEKYEKPVMEVIDIEEEMKTAAPDPGCPGKFVFDDPIVPIDTSGNNP